jgi:hypothetical protein
LLRSAFCRCVFGATVSSACHRSPNRATNSVLTGSIQLGRVPEPRVRARRGSSTAAGRPGRLMKRGCHDRTSCRNRRLPCGFARRLRVVAVNIADLPDQLRLSESWTAPGDGSGPRGCETKSTSMRSDQAGVITAGAVSRTVRTRLRRQASRSWPSVAIAIRAALRAGDEVGGDDHDVNLPTSGARRQVPAAGQFRYGGPLPIHSPHE